MSARKEAFKSKMGFVFTQGGLRGLFYGLRLSEIYALLFAIAGGIFSILHGDASGFLEFLLGVIFFFAIEQFFGVLPSLIVGFFTGALIATLGLFLKSRDEKAAGLAGALVSTIVASPFILLTFPSGRMHRYEGVDPLSMKLVSVDITVESILVGSTLFLLPALTLMVSSIIVTIKSRKLLPIHFSKGKVTNQALSIALAAVIILLIVSLVYKIANLSY